MLSSTTIEEERRLVKRELKEDNYVESVGQNPSEAESACNRQAKTYDVEKNEIKVAIKDDDEVSTASSGSQARNRQRKEFIWFTKQETGEIHQMTDWRQRKDGIDQEILDVAMNAVHSFKRDERSKEDLAPQLIIGAVNTGSGGSLSNFQNNDQQTISNCATNVQQLTWVLKSINALTRHRHRRSSWRNGRWPFWLWNNKSKAEKAPNNKETTSDVGRNENKNLNEESDNNNRTERSTCEDSTGASKSSSSSFLDEDWKKRLQDKRDQLMDRAAIVTSWLLSKHDESQDRESDTLGLNVAVPTADASSDQDLDAITKQSNFKASTPRPIHIVTTAALPWYTGTAINPLLRAAYLYQAIQAYYQPKNDNKRRDKYNHSSRGSDEQTNDTASLLSPSARVSVTLVVPWLERPEDQHHLFQSIMFESPEEQEDYIRSWLREEAGLPDAADGIRILFYPARYHEGLRSIFAMGDLIQDVIVQDAAAQEQIQVSMGQSALETTAHGHNNNLDICILEEPEHCNWFRAPGDGWTQQFQYVVGIIHTNYKEYAATSHYSGLWTAPALAMICSAMVRAYCHKVIKLSDALQTFCPPGKEVTSNVHGVREEFWQQGLKLAKQLRQHGQQQQNQMHKSKEENSTYDSHKNNEKCLAGEEIVDGGDELLIEPKVYFLGKLLWAKGLDILLDLQEYYKQCTGSYFEIDIYGSGPDSEDIQRAYSKKKSSSSTTGSGFSSLMTTTSSKSINSFTPFSSLINTDAIPPSAIALTQSSTYFLNSLGNSLQTQAKQHWSSFKTSFLGQAEMMPLRLALLPLLKRVSQEPIPASFLGRVDHARLPKDYTVFVNPSVSEVLCTATAEALAMGKFVIVPYHPSNYWFFQFPNCLQYRNKLEFAANLRWALSHNPKPLTEEQAKEFSWQAATERLFQAAAMTNREAAAAMHASSKQEAERIAWFHNEVLGKGTRGDLVRKVLGAGPVSEQVRYQQELAQQLQKEDITYKPTNVTSNGDSPTKNSEGEGADEDDVSNGLGQGFAQSWFATAFRRAWNDAAKMGNIPLSSSSTP